jgi:DNA-binding response OmpR family regulator
VGSILLVESDPDTRDRLGDALRAAGHEVLVSTTTREAFLRVSEGGIDVIIVDAHDPRGGATELARQLDTLPDAPPIVLVSGSPYAPEISARIGAAAFVPKPCDASEVVAVVERHAGEVRPVRVIEDFDDEGPTGPARQAG